MSDEDERSIAVGPGGCRIAGYLVPGENGLSEYRPPPSEPDHDEDDLILPVWAIDNETCHEWGNRARDWFASHLERDLGLGHLGPEAAHSSHEYRRVNASLNLRCVRCGIFDAADEGDPCPADLHPQVTAWMRREADLVAELLERGYDGERRRVEARDPRGVPRG